MKQRRQARILEIVNNFDIKTQDEITNILQKEGFKVTQATVSRDLRDLKLTKNMSSVGRYRYIASTVPDGLGDVRLTHAITAAILGVKYSQNDIVIKTLPGMAQAVASAVDALNIDGILGCVAGDDTIIVVAIDAEQAAQISEKIKELLKSY